MPLQHYVIRFWNSYFLLGFKPFPIDRDHFQLGSLSHLLNAKAGGYQELPDWPEVAPDPSVRNVEVKDSVREVGRVNRHLRPLGEGLGVLLLQNDMTSEGACHHYPDSSPFDVITFSLH